MAEDERARSLYYSPTPEGAEKSVFGSHGGTRISAGTKPGQEYSTNDIGGLGGLTDYYEKLENTGVMYWVELVQTGSSTVKRVPGSRVFRSGDRIRVHITTNGDGYLQALHRGTTGVNKLVPVSTGGRVSGGNEVVIPPGGGWLRFDEAKGIEQIDLVFASHAGAVERGIVPTSNNQNLIQHVQHTIEQVSLSKDLVTYEQGGEKDLIVEGGSVVTTPVVFNRPGGPDPQVVSAPANYAVNTAGAPAVVKVRLNHQ
jgi:hypothetical protein